MAEYDKYANSWLYNLGDKLGDMIILSVLWLIFSLPIITIGPASAALYYAVVRRFRLGYSGTIHDFLRGFRQNLKQGVALTLIFIIYGSLVALDILFARRGIGNFKLPSFYGQVAYVLLLPMAFTLPYVFAYLSRFSNTVKATLRDSFFLSASHFFHTLGILILVIGSAIVMPLFPPAALVVPALCALICSFMIENDFAKIIADNPGAFIPSEPTSSFTNVNAPPPESETIPEI
ncbi:MAG: YesL family protein [Clostridiaceae bacterium]|nr:YesL family protein [Clostridiaceae bacterium]